MSVRVIPVWPEQPHNLFDDVTAAVDRASADSGEVWIAFAYATTAGVRSFLDVVSYAQNWQAIRKQIVVGVHNAITEPAALSELRSIQSVQLRAFVPGGNLTESAFSRKPLFHPKMIAVRDRGNLVAVFAGSPNLTSAAVGVSPSNYELAVSAVATSGVPFASEESFSDWWTDVWQNSRKVDAKFIHSYARARKTTLEANPILRKAMEVPDSIAEASHMFLEVGAGSGPPGSRHQVEFPESLARFFGELRRERRNLTLSAGGEAWDQRPLSYKKTSFEVDIWRLGMPTQTKGGPPIAERAIRFSRTSTLDHFDFEVVEVDSEDFRGWETAANLSGHVGATHGSRTRRFGFY